MDNKFDVLSQSIKYHFIDEQLLILALTHKSFIPAQQKDFTNERLEFLGDSIVNLIIANDLFHRFPEAEEGVLTRFRALLVNKFTLAELAREFDLGEYLILGPGEQKSGGAFRDSILADALEALIGALFIETGFDKCQSIVLHWFNDRLNRLALNEESKDPKSRLQEYLQARQQILPEYHIVKIKGKSHDQTFEIACKVSILTEDSIGIGRNRRVAEQEAAKKALIELGIDKL